MIFLPSAFSLLPSAFCLLAFPVRLQRRYLCTRQLSKLAGPNPVVRDRPDPHAAKPHHGVSDRVAHRPNLPITALVNDN